MKENEGCFKSMFALMVNVELLNAESHQYGFMKCTIFPMIDKLDAECCRFQFSFVSLSIMFFAHFLFSSFAEHFIIANCTVAILRFFRHSVFIHFYFLRTLFFSCFNILDFHSYNISLHRSV